MLTFDNRLNAYIILFRDVFISLDNNNNFDYIIKGIWASCKQTTANYYSTKQPPFNEPIEYVQILLLLNIHTSINDWRERERARGWKSGGRALMGEFTIAKTPYIKEDFCDNYTQCDK